MRTRVIALVLGVLGTAACATTPLDPLVEQGRFSEAVRVFERDSSLHSNESALYRVALLHARSRYSTYDPARARELLGRLLRLHPHSTYRDEALTMLPLLDDVVALRDGAERRGRLAAARMLTLRMKVASLRREIVRLEDRLESHETEAATLEAVIARLEGQVREKDLEVQSLQEELDRLKEIDLRTARPTGDSVAAPPDSAGDPPR